MDLFENIKNGKKVLIGMIHCLPIPGTLGGSATLGQVIQRAVEDAKVLEHCGFDAVMVENEDRAQAPHMTKLQFAAMSMVARAVREAVSIPMGLCLGCLNYEEAITICKVAGGQFIRVPIFVDTVMNYHGIIEPCSADVQACRTKLGAQDIRILADVQVKYYYMVNPQITVAQSAVWAEKQGADAVIVTGLRSGAETSLEDLRDVKKNVHIPVAVGSGVTEQNIAQQLEVSDIMIIGTTLRYGGKMSEPIDPERAATIVVAAGGKT